MFCHNDMSQSPVDAIIASKQTNTNILLSHNSPWENTIYAAWYLSLFAVLASSNAAPVAWCWRAGAECKGSPGWTCVTIVSFLLKVDSQVDVLVALASWTKAKPQERTCIYATMFGESLQSLNFVSSDYCNIYAGICYSI